MNHEEFGTSADYFLAFDALVAEGIPEKHLSLLRAHHAAPEHTTTWAQLAAEVGYAHGKAVNLQYGTLAGRVANRMGIAEVPNGFWLDVLAGWTEQPDVVSGHTSFVLRRPVIDALTKLGLLARDTVDLGELETTGHGDHENALGNAGRAKHASALVAGVPRDKVDHVFRWSQVLTVEQYFSGLERISSDVSETQRRILECQYYSPGHTAYATQLARAACITGRQRRPRCDPPHGGIWIHGAVSRGAHQAALC